MKRYFFLLPALFLNSALLVAAEPTLVQPSTSVVEKDISPIDISLKFLSDINGIILNDEKYRFKKVDAGKYNFSHKEKFFDKNKLIFTGYLDEDAQGKKIWHKIEPITYVISLDTYKIKIKFEKKKNTLNLTVYKKEKKYEKDWNWKKVKEHVSFDIIKKKG